MQYNSLFIKLLLNLNKIDCYVEYLAKYKISINVREREKKKNLTWYLAVLSC